MSTNTEMEAMMAHAPGCAVADPLTWVLCVEATAKTQQALEAALSTPAPAASVALRTLPGTRLRLSRFTTVQTIRVFLQGQEAGIGAADAPAAAAATAAKDRRSLAHAHFFAVRVPAVDGAAAAEAASDAFVALPPTATLDDVLGSGPVLRCGSPDAGADAVDTLVLVYMRDSEFGFDDGDMLLCGLCACLCACCIAMCASSASEKMEEDKRRRRYEQQQQQQQYHNNQNQYNNNNYNTPPQNQPYYQGNAGAGQQYSYGAPPQQYQNGYPVAQPAYHNYSGRPEYAQQGQPVQQGQPMQQNPPAQYYYAQPQNQQQGGNYYQSNNTGNPAPL